MKIVEIHPLDITIETFKSIQRFLSAKISLENRGTRPIIHFFARVDIAYWEEAGSKWRVCSIAVINYKTEVVVEKVYSIGKFVHPYIPGYLAFRELPLILEVAKKLVITARLAYI